MQNARFPVWFAIAVLALSVCPTSPTGAQSLGGVAVEPSHEKEPYRIDVAYAHRFETDLDDNGKFSEDNVFVRFVARTKLVRSVDWHNIAFYGYSGYNFSNTGRGGWWGDVHSLTYVPALSWQINRRWSVFGGPVLHVAAESGADFGDGVMGGGLGGFMWSPDPSLVLGAGLVALSRIEDDATLAPVPIVRWQFADDWRLRAGLETFAARQGFGLEVGWTASEQIDLSAGLAFQRIHFRMDEEGPSCVAGDGQCQTGSTIDDGVGDDRSVPIFGRATFGIGQGLDLEVSAGVALAGEMRLEDRKGRKIEKDDYDPQGVIGLRLISVF